MLKKKHRLPLMARSKRIKTVSTDYFLIKISKNDLLDSRFGFLVSKKIDKRAVVRNRLKRTYRSIVEELAEKIDKGYDLLFVIKKGSKEEKREVILDAFEKTLAREKLLK